MQIACQLRELGAPTLGSGGGGGNNWKDYKFVFIYKKFQVDDVDKWEDEVSV